jgi:hypothetical protein
MRESDGGRDRKDSKSTSRVIPNFLSCATPDEFLVWLTLSSVHRGLTLFWDQIVLVIYLFIYLFIYV